MDPDTPVVYARSGAGLLAGFEEFLESLLQGTYYGACVRE
jgi:hypothetical protein